MASYTNKGEGARGVVDSDGNTIWAEPGQTIEVANADKVHPDFEGDDGETGDGLADITVAELKAIAEAEGVDLGEATKKAEIIAAIEAARAAG